jgi:hypothetical protein
MQLFLVPQAVAKDQIPLAAVLIDDLSKTFREWDIKEEGASLQLRELNKRER